MEKEKETTYRMTNLQAETFRSEIENGKKTTNDVRKEIGLDSISQNK